MLYKSTAKNPPTSPVQNSKHNARWIGVKGGGDPNIPSSSTTKKTLERFSSFFCYFLPPPFQPQTALYFRAFPLPLISSHLPAEADTHAVQHMHCRVCVCVPPTDAQNHNQ